MTDTTISPDLLPIDPTVKPGPGKIPVLLIVQWRIGTCRTERWFRWADPDGIDPEHHTASNLAAVALTNDPTLTAFLVGARDGDMHPDAAQAQVFVNDPRRIAADCDGWCPLYDETLPEMWDTLNGGIDAPPAWDWNVQP